MEIQFKVNTGIMKTGKNSQTRFCDEDFENLNALENKPLDLFIALLKNKIKHTFNKLEFRDKVDINMLLHKGIKDINFNKSIRGCFITYNFDIK